MMWTRCRQQLEIELPEKYVSSQGQFPMCLEKEEDQKTTSPTIKCMF